MEQDVRYSLSDDQKRIVAGENETVFRMVEDRFSVKILSRLPGLTIRKTGENSDVQGALAFLDQLKIAARNGTFLSQGFLARILDETGGPASPKASEKFVPEAPLLRNRMGIPVAARTPSQAKLIKACETNDIIFADGPAGTGKTFLAVAIAVASLELHETERICLVRPAVEAGESLGYLPGDLKEKISPYLRPIQDSLSELLSPEKLRKYQEGGQIEVAPLAYMRGRTLTPSSFSTKPRTRPFRKCRCS